MDEQTCTRRIAWLADAQYGVVGRGQLLSAGIGRGAIDARIDRGLLIPLHRGVYAVGHRRLRRDGVWLAAVLAGGPGAVLSHRDAGALHGLGTWEAGRVEVSTARSARSTAVLRVFPRRALAAEDVTRIGGIPVTTVARTLVDLADVIGPQRLANALAEAERAQLLDRHALDAARRRVLGRRGRGQGVLARVLEEHARHGAQLTRSRLEMRLRRIVGDHGLPRPQLNARVEGEEVDALWRAARLCVEADGWAFHRDRGAFARDRAKTNKLTLAGWTVLRFTHHEIRDRPAHVGAAIRTALLAADRRDDDSRTAHPAGRRRPASTADPAGRRRPARTAHPAGRRRPARTAHPA